MTLVQEFQIKLLDGLRTLSNPEEFQILFYNLLIEQGPVSLFLILENPESRNFELLDLQTADESIRRSFSEKVWSVEQIERDDFVSEDIDGGIAESHLLKYVFPNPKISEQEVYYAYWKISDEKRLWIICDFHGENSLQLAEIFSYTASTFALNSHFIDTIKQNKKEAGRRQKQNNRFQAMGTLAAGVAHEVNNPLTGMINFSQLIYDKSENEKIKRYAWSVMKEGNRIANIVRKLLSYTGFREEPLILVNPVDILNDAISILRSTFRSEFIIVRQKKQGTIPAGTYPGQLLEQVFINLLLNSRDALNDKFPQYHPEKVIDIQIYLESVDKKTFITILFVDNGEGIQKDIYQDIFRAGYSTKNEYSNGLGLHICKEIIEEIDGNIDILSEPGRSAEFRVRIPVYKKNRE
ncbi:hypothetical protein KAJ27_17915 [bacterium]|nr:hypothetical protein [bacterium]